MNRYVDQHRLAAQDVLEFCGFFEKDFQGLLTRSKKTCLSKMKMMSNVCKSYSIHFKNKKNMDVNLIWA